MKYQKGQVWLIIVLILVLLAVGWYFLIYNKGAATGGIYQTTAPVATTNPSPAGYQNSKDLDTASSQLDGTNLNQMDSGINQVTQDSSSF